MIFSVIIPCYNCVKTLEATVNSIRVCGLSDYEILLIDDGSNDGTAELCDRLCGKMRKSDAFISRTRVYLRHETAGLMKHAGSIFGLWILMTRWTKIRLAVF